MRVLDTAAATLLVFAACSSASTPGPPAAAGAAAFVPAPADRAELRYSVMTADRIAGAEVVTRAPDGTIIAKYHYSDRGRGAELTTRLWPGKDGLAWRMEVRGVDYLKVPVEEDFAREGDQVTWKNASEDASATVSGPAYYLALNRGSEAEARLAQALLRSANGKLPIVPAGEASIATLGTAEVSRGTERRTVTLYAISGINFDPVFVWLEADQTMFANLLEWGGTIREGWEASAETLRTRQRELGRVRLVEMAKRLTHRPSGPVAFQHVGVFDPLSRRVRPNQTVVIRGARIAAVGPAARVQIPAGAEVIDGKGKTLLPGLWDMHVHVGETDGIQHLAAGVTSVRDLGNNIEQVIEVKRVWEEGTVLGPRVMYSGFIDGPGPYAGPIGELVSTEEEIRAAIARYAEKGVEQIKLYNSLDTRLVPIAIAEAKARGLPVSGHVPNGMRASEFVERGATELQHMNFLVLNFLDVPDTRTLERHHAVGREAAGIDLSSPKVQSFIKLLRDKKTIVDTTVSIFDDRFTLEPGDVDPMVAPAIDRLPVAVGRQFRRGHIAPKGMEERYRASFDMLLRYIGELHRKGVLLVIGSDAIPGFALHREIENYVRAGIPPGEVLRIATLGAAHVMRRADRLGSIAAGKEADLVLVEGDPTRRIEDIRNTVLTVKAGHIYRTDELHEAIGIRPR